MNHYENVLTILEAVQDYSEKKEELEKLMLIAGKYNQVEMLTEDLMYVMISLWGGTTPEFKREFLARLADETITHEINELFWQEEHEITEDDLSKEYFDSLKKCPECGAELIYTKTGEHCVRDLSCGYRVTYMIEEDDE